MESSDSNDSSIEEEEQNEECALCSASSSDLDLLKGVFAKNERGYRLNAIKKRF